VIKTSIFQGEDEIFIFLIQEHPAYERESKFFKVTFTNKWQDVAKLLKTLVKKQMSARGTERRLLHTSD